MRLWAFNKLYVFSANTEFNEQILSSTTHLTKGDMYNILIPWTGPGIVVSDGERWHTHRKIITPAFHFTILEEFLEIFNRQSSVLLESLLEVANGKTAFNVLPYLSSIVLNVFAETSMGIKVDDEDGRIATYIQSARE